MFTTFFFQPIFNLLIVLYNIIPGHDFGLVIIIFTIVIKLILLPLTKKQLKSQKALQDLQPKMEEIKVKYADKKEEMGKEMMKLYQENKVNPFSSCLPLIIQLPILFAVFKIFREGFQNGSLDLVYSFISRPESINTIAFGFVDLSNPNAYLAVMAGIAQFFQAKMLIIKKPAVKGSGSKDEGMAAIMNKQMLYFLPVFTVIICLSLPGALPLYWFVTTVFTIAQQVYMFKKDDADKSGGVIEGEVVK